MNRLSYFHTLQNLSNLRARRDARKCNSEMSLVLAIILSTLTNQKKGA
jgi:hypothetical protein